MDRRFPPRQKEKEYEAVIDIPADYNVGSLIGSKGANIQRIKDQTGCRIIRVLDTQQVRL
jgi:hypothetical protein